MNQLLTSLLVVLTAIIGGTAAQNYCNVTNDVTFTTACRACALNRKVKCPDGSTQQTGGRGLMDCDYQVTDADTDTVLKIGGCRHQCQKSVIWPTCCDGYWGPDCQDCPGVEGGSVCSGHGKCDDGITGTGVCDCQPEFNGTACEKCRDEGNYGTDCSGECLCDQGICSNGRDGDGSCHCHSGYTGILCDKEIPSCKKMQCPENSACSIDDATGLPKCACAYGFTTDGTTCIAIDGCEQIAKCHKRADCTNTGPGTFQCECVLGFMGDGTVCQVIDPCQQDYGGCDLETMYCSYESPGQAACECSEGYANVTGQGCDLIDLCANNDTLCHDLANCTMVAPLVAQCICPDGYIGDGVNCYGNLLQRMKDLHSFHPELKGQLDTMIELMELGYDQELTHGGGTFTVFAVIDSAFPDMIVGRYKKEEFLTKAHWARQLLRAHIVPRIMTLDDLVNVSTVKSLANYQVRLRNSVIRGGQQTYMFYSGGTVESGHGDIVASNGIIHVTNKVFRCRPIPRGDPPSLEEYLKRSRGILYTLMQSVGLDAVIDGASGPLTMFDPAISMTTTKWGKLPDVTYSYLRSDEGKGKLLAILQNHIIPNAQISALELVGMHQFTSMGDVANSVSVDDVGQVQLNGNVSFVSFETPLSNGVVYRLGDILIPDSLKPILPQRCDTYSHGVVKGSCGPCTGEHHCTNLKDTPLEDSTRPGCRFWSSLGGKTFKMLGCSILCNRTYTKPACCPGFYGPECLPCPGDTFKEVCFGRGQCDDGLTGSGNCTCDPEYSGTVCERCVDPTKYGPGCNFTCNCLHGECDNRVTPAYRTRVSYCKRGSCQPGYTGRACDIKKMTCDGRSLHCHAHAECVEMKPSALEVFSNVSDTVFQDMSPDLQALLEALVDSTGKIRKPYPTCQCKDGYKGVRGRNCKEIDPCAQPDRGGCHLQAKCVKTGPGQSECVCNPGFVGDGLYCYPGTGCNVHVQCHENARCARSSPRRFLCICKEDFHGNGTYCVPNNPCDHDHGGCHKMARCDALGPGNRTCECADGYGGDGITCYGSILTEITANSELTALAQLLTNLPSNDVFLLDMDSNFTFFAPTNQAIDEFMSAESSDFWTKEANLLPFISYHSLPVAVEVSELRREFLGQRLKTMASNDNNMAVLVNVTARGTDVYVNEAKVVLEDLSAINGYIHIIDKVLEPYPISWDRPDLKQLLASKPQFSHFYHLLLAHDLIEEIEDMDEYTLFAPSNDAMGPDVNPADKRYFLYYVVPGTLPLSQLEDDTSIFNMLGSSPQHSLSITRTGIGKVLVNGVEVNDPNLLTEGGVVHGIASLLDPVLNRCDSVRLETKMGPCVACTRLPLPCPPDYAPSSSPQDDMVKCTYTIRSLKVRQVAGCQLMCVNTTTERKCCKEYYGPHCQECPGSANEPCSGHGLCDDTWLGTGLCLCDGGYTGKACEECPAGNCTADPCSSGVCDDNAQCIFKPDVQKVSCRCKLGYIGDGYVCKSKCDHNNGGCHPAAVCSVGDRGVECNCAEEYSGDGYTCSPLVDNRCEWKNGGCSADAVCSLLPKSDPAFMAEAKCTCKAGYTGNGTTCVAAAASAAASYHQNKKHIGAIVGGIAAVAIIVAIVIVVVRRWRQSAYVVHITSKVRGGGFNFGRFRSTSADVVRFKSATDVREDSGEQDHVSITQFNNPMYSLEAGESGEGGATAGQDLNDDGL